MKLAYDDEHDALRESLRRALGTPIVAAAKEHPQDPVAQCKMWGLLSDMGLLDADDPQYGAVELGIVAEEIGQALAPLPIAEWVLASATLQVCATSTDPGNDDLTAASSVMLHLSRSDDQPRLSRTEIGRAHV